MKTSRLKNYDLKIIARATEEAAGRLPPVVLEVSGPLHPLPVEAYLDRHRLLQHLEPRRLLLVVSVALEPLPLLSSALLHRHRLELQPWGDLEHLLLLQADLAPRLLEPRHQHLEVCLEHQLHRLGCSGPPLPQHLEAYLALPHQL